MLGFSTLLILLQMKSRKLKNVYFFFYMGRLITTSRLIISDTSCFKNPLKRLYPSWSLCHQHVLLELNIHSANTTKSRFGALVPEQWDWMRWNGVLQSVKTTLEHASGSILQLISCARKKCSTQHCTCLKSGVKCSVIAKCVNDIACQNHNYQDSPLSRNDKNTHVINLPQVYDSTDSECEYDYINSRNITSWFILK